MPDKDHDKLLALYNAQLLALSARADHDARLPNPAYTAHAVSPICGSTVDIDFNLDSTGKITALGFAVEACALTKAVIGALVVHAPGKTTGDVLAAGMVLQKMLADENVTWPAAWQVLRILEPVRDYKARHNAIMLPFEAIEKALKNKT